MQFPFSLGAMGGFYSEPRINKSRRAIDNAVGKGGLAQDWTLATNRKTLAALARVHASVSLSTERIGYEMFPLTALPFDLLPFWEEKFKIDRAQPDTIADRQWNADRVIGDMGRRMPCQVGEGAGRGTDETFKLDQFVGVGNTTYRFNTRTGLLAIGADQRGIFRVAFEVPVQFIDTVQKHTNLLKIARRYVPAHVGIAITNTGNGARGFRCDDPLSLCNRDVLRI